MERGAFLAPILGNPVTLRGSSIWINRSKRLSHAMIAEEREQVSVYFRMELAIRIHVEQLPEGLFLATSDELSGLVAQGRTVAEALDIARDVARKLIEARRERDGLPDLPTITDRSDYTIVVPA